MVIGHVRFVAAKGAEALSGLTTRFLVVTGYATLLGDRRFILLALTFAGPLLIVMLATDVILGIAAKVGKRVDVTFLAMSIKTLIAVLLLPLV